MPPPDNALLPEAWLELPDGRTFWLKGSCAIGRQPDNDVVLERIVVSRRHALITPGSDSYMLSDLHSTSGTFLNRAAVARPVALRDNDEIRLGDALVRFRCTRRLAHGSAPVDFGATQRLNDVRERPCWLLLVDVVGFTTLNERDGSESAVRQMQAWITAIRPLIEGHEGHINGYLGDAIFAYWLADTVPPSALLASLRAIERWRPASPLVFRVVAHHGKVLFTHNDRGEELTGQDVNFAFRSEKLAKTFGVSAMLSEAAMRTLGLEGRCASCGQAPLDGISGTFSFYTLPRDLSA